MQPAARECYMHVGARSKVAFWLGQVRAPYRSAHIFFSSAVPPLVLDAIRSCPLLVGALRSLKEVRVMGPHSQPGKVGDCCWWARCAASKRCVA